MNINQFPIYLEYYSHDKCKCYKIDLPWPRFAKEKMVLCREEEGLAHAILLAKGVLMNHIQEALNRSVVDEDATKVLFDKSYYRSVDTYVVDGITHEYQKMGTGIKNGDIVYLASYIDSNEPIGYNHVDPTWALYIKADSIPNKTSAYGIPRRWLYNTKTGGILKM